MSNTTTMIVKMDKQLPLKKRKSSIEFNHETRLQQLVQTNQLYAQQQQLLASWMTQLLNISTNTPVAHVDQTESQQASSPPIQSNFTATTPTPVVDATTAAALVAVAQQISSRGSTGASNKLQVNTTNSFTSLNLTTSANNTKQEQQLEKPKRTSKPSQNNSISQLVRSASVHQLQQQKQRKINDDLMTSKARHEDVDQRAIRGNLNLLTIPALSAGFQFDQQGFGCSTLGGGVNQDCHEDNDCENPSELTLANSQQAQMQLQQQFAVENFLLAQEQIKRQKLSRHFNENEDIVDAMDIEKDNGKDQSEADLLNSNLSLNLSTKTSFPFLPIMDHVTKKISQPNIQFQLMAKRLGSNTDCQNDDHMKNYETDNLFLTRHPLNLAKQDFEVATNLGLKNHQMEYQRHNQQVNFDSMHDKATLENRKTEDSSSEKDKKNEPSNDQDHDEATRDMPQICMICHDKATGLHYGIITCEGCKGFFKRTVQNKRVYTCASDNKCAITKQQRNRCQSCRLQKCLKQGMVLAAVREDRMPGGRNSGAVYNLYKVKYKKHKKKKLESSSLSTTSLSSTSSVASSTPSLIFASSGSPSSLNNVQLPISLSTGSTILKSALMSPILEPMEKRLVPMMH